MAHAEVGTTLTGNSTPLQQALAKGKADVNSFAASTKTAMGGVGKAMASLGVGIGLGALVRSSMDKYGVQVMAERKLAAVIKATGGAAGWSAGELNKFAADLQKVTNFADETTISAMGVLASFREIKGDMFKEATIAAQDMAAVMGGDLQGAILQIGKALQDPTLGATALRRAGVSFSQDQMEAIKNFQESGDLLSAQRIIMDELKGEFGGAAKATASAWKQACNEMGDKMEKFGGVCAPVLTAIAAGFNKIMGIGEGLGKWIENAPAWVTGGAERSPAARAAMEREQAGEDPYASWRKDGKAMPKGAWTDRDVVPGAAGGEASEAKPREGETLTLRPLAAEWRSAMDKYREGVNDLSQAQRAGEISAASYAARMKTLNLAFHEADILTPAEEYAKALHEINESVQDGLDATQAARQKKKALEVFGPEILTPAERYAKAIRDVNDAMAAGLGQTQGVRQKARAAKELRDESGITAFRDSLKTADDRAEEAMANLDKMREGIGDQQITEEERKKGLLKILETLEASQPKKPEAHAAQSLDLLGFYRQLNLGAQGQAPTVKAAQDTTRKVGDVEKAVRDLIAVEKKRNFAGFQW